MQALFSLKPRSAPCPEVGFSELGEGGRLLDGVSLHDALDGLPDRGEGDAAVEEGFDGGFVGGVHDGGQCAAGLAGVAGEAQRGEDIIARRFKMQ